jgi:hypothetical protein
MNKTLTATYASEDTLRNVEEELVGAAGIPREQVFVEKKSKQIKVIIPAATEDEVRKILQAHRPKKMAERDWTKAPAPSPPPPAAAPAAPAPSDTYRREEENRT